MAAEFPGWIVLNQAMKRYRTTRETLLGLVEANVLTAQHFTAGEKQPPLYLRLVELDAWNRGGINAVKPLKDAFERAERELAAAHTHDVGGEG